MFPAEFISKLFDAASRNNVLDKLAGSTLILDRLEEARRESDLKHYTRKHELLKSVIDENPNDFFRDGDVQPGNFIGITHRPTGYQFHLPERFITKVSNA